MRNDIMFINFDFKKIIFFLSSALGNKKIKANVQNKGSYNYIVNQPVPYVISMFIKSYYSTPDQKRLSIENNGSDIYIHQYHGLNLHCHQFKLW